MGEWRNGQRLCSIFSPLFVYSFEDYTVEFGTKINGNPSPSFICPLFFILLCFVYNLISLSSLSLSLSRRTVRQFRSDSFIHGFDVPSSETDAPPCKRKNKPLRLFGCQTNHRQQCRTGGDHPTSARPRFPMDSAGPPEDHSLEAASVTESAAPADSPSPAPPSRYESQKRRDWNTFLQYLRNHKPPLTLGRCSGAHVIEFLKYLDQFGKTKVHNSGCPYFGHPNPPAPCACPLKQAWGSLDALIGRLRAAYEENGGRPESNPFAEKAVRIYLREVREGQAKARGIPYEKKKRKRPTSAPVTASQPSGIVSYVGEGSGSAGDDAGDSAASTTAAVATTTV